MNMNWNMEIKLPASRAAGASAILFGALAVIAVGLYLMGSVVGAANSELEAKTTQVAALQRRAQMPALPPAALSDQNVFLEGANYALAANSLQQHIVATIEQSGGKLLTVSVEAPVSNEQTSRRVIVQVRSELDNDALQNLLYSLETGSPLVLLDSLNVHRAAQGDNDKSDSKQSPKLTVDLRAVGFYRRGTP